MYSSAPDTPSPVYPDRLIRPLPKRPLRTRLSSDAADSILYPPAPPATQLFYGACADSGEVVNDAKVYVQQSEGHDHSPERDHLPYENGVDVESGDEDGPVVVHRSAGFRGSPLSPSAVNSQPQPHPGNGEGTPIKSSAGPDGYDAFENTNNKKKRKIPTPGNLGSHSTLSPEFSSMGLTSSAPSTGPPGDGSHVSTFYGTGSPASPVGHGMSGPGRGRLGRHAHRNSTGRGSVSHPSPVAWSQGRGPARRDGLSSPGSTGRFPSGWSVSLPCGIPLIQSRGIHELGPGDHLRCHRQRGRLGVSLPSPRIEGGQHARTAGHDPYQDPVHLYVRIRLVQGHGAPAAEPVRGHASLPRIDRGGPEPAALLDAGDADQSQHRVPDEPAAWSSAICRGARTQSCRTEEEAVSRQHLCAGRATTQDSAAVYQSAPSSEFGRHLDLRVLRVREYLRSSPGSFDSTV